MKLIAAAAFIAGLLTSLGVAGAAEPAAPFGLWRVADGSAVIRIKSCGPALCGFVAGAPPPGPGEKSVVGQKILLDMRREGAVWRGSIYNIDDGKTYDGEISIGDETRLKIKGCLPGGGLCGGETWKREVETRSR